jgi:citrate lyase subunit beta / citryl-CoA lyase
MSRCIVAARASGKIVIDGVHMDLKDETGLINSCIQGRNLGFDGKSLIHPSQIEITNHHFSPYESEIVHAQNTVDSYNKAILAGNSLCVVDDKLVEEVISLFIVLIV